MKPTTRLLLALLLAACATPGAAPAPPSPWPPDPPAYRPAEGWWREAVFYEVFVRSFQDSDGDGVGDLRGLIQRLDYLNDGDPATTTDLGVDALWLMPVFASPSYHGYDTTDYEAIEPDYGAPADFRDLVVEAHRRGLEVIVDLVLNHTSSQHPWFRAAARSAADPRRDWYVWSPTDPGWTQPWNAGQGTWYPAGGAWYYGLFWSGMPDLNWRNPAVAAEAARLARLWLDRGVDGFRLDAVRYLLEDGAGQQADRPATHAALKAFAAAVRAHKPGATLVGEAWADTLTTADYYGDTAAVPGGDELPLLFDFPLATQLVAGVASGSADGIDFTLRDVLATYPPGATDAPFLTNHDQVRVATALGGDPDKLKLAATVLLTLPGAPFLYYGEELGLRNRDDGNDESKRTPMPWDGSAGRGFTSGAPWYPFSPGPPDGNVAAQAGDPASILSRYRQLIRVRQGSAALRRGALGPLTSGSPALLAFTRATPGETVLVVHNLSGASATAAALSAPGSAATALYQGPGATIGRAAGAWTVTLPARASGVWRLE
jgi:alpha-amylase